VRAVPRPVRFGFLGAGWIAARALAPAVHAADGAVLQAAASRDPARAAALEPAGRRHSRYQDLLADEQVDVVYVCLTNEAHRPWALAALAAGKHVLCEKPLGLRPFEVEELATAAAGHGRILVEALWYRWHPRTRRLQQLVDSGALGRLRHVEAEFSFAGDFTGEAAGNYRLDPARGGGALLDTGCYALSAAHLLLGSRLRVDRATQTALPTGVDGETRMRLTAQAGAHAGAGADVRCGIVTADRQVLRVEGEHAAAHLAGAGGATGGEAFTTWNVPCSLVVSSPDGSYHVEEFAATDAYRLMVQQVAAAARGEDAFLVDLAHSAQVSASTDRARRMAGSDATAPVSERRSGPGAAR
jgi:predicted dehydrogenase